MARSEKSHEVWGIVFVFLGAFSLLSLVSYHHADPSFFTRSPLPPRNYGGRIGANLAEILVQIGGLSSFIFSFLCFSFAAKLFRGATVSKLAGNLAWIVLAVIASATLSSLQFGPVGFGDARLPAGGALGGWLAALLRAYLNLWGATLFTLCALLVALVFSTPLSAAVLFRWSGLLILALFAALAALTRKTAAAIRDSRFVQKRLAEKTISEGLAEKLRQTTLDGIGDTRATEQPWDAAERRKALKVIEGTRSVPKKEKPAKPTAPSEPGNYTLPSLDLLNEPPPVERQLDKAKLAETSALLEQKLNTFGIEGSVEAVRTGPVITMYEFKPGPGVKISQIAHLAEDLSLALSAPSVRIVAPIPGKSVVGIEIPNDERESVYLREILANEEFQDARAGIPIAVGKDIAGRASITDLATMPHLMIAGSTGTGKSVFVNSLICSLLYKFTPRDLRLIMVDPKMLEFNLYENIPHLLLPIVDDPKKASTALKWAVNEMERRYKIMAKSGVRNLLGFNQRLERDGEEKMRGALCPKDSAGMPHASSISHLLDHDEKGEPRVERLPYILVIIDEFADLMMTTRNDVEESVLRIAQKARAAGIHLVIATQRPSVDVVTGLVKANLQSRISFKVASRTDSRTVLDSNGAEKLLGSGDMLFIPPGQSQLVRLHGAFVSEGEVGKICGHWREQGVPVFREEILIEAEEGTDGETPDGAGDALYGQAVTHIREVGTASASMLQRRFKVGYNRAARMIEAMEAQGLVGPQDGAKPREVIYT
ncbi:MAG: DNA translocase FtsK 4TM domain-containing protein [Deltaproteobacteria bacterium]|nr:DNA translocase FtsK 4TM domain-containing protein [Deltaproteobacteria bacterium]